MDDLKNQMEDLKNQMDDCKNQMDDLKNQMDDFEICEECEFLINCSRDNIYIITKDDKEILWCKDCFDDLWEDAYKNGWGGDDIESQLELDKE